jgi:hypothetical protein
MNRRHFAVFICLIPPVLAGISHFAVKRLAYEQGATGDPLSFYDPFIYCFLVIGFAAIGSVLATRLAILRQWKIVLIVANMVGMVFGARGALSWDHCWFAGFADYATKRWTGPKLSAAINQFSKQALPNKGWIPAINKEEITWLTWSGISPSVKVATNGNATYCDVRWLINRDCKVGLLFSEGAGFPDDFGVSVPTTIQIDNSLWVCLTR